MRESTGWTEGIERYVQAQRAAGRSSESIRTRLSYLRRFAAHHPAGPGSVSGEQLAGWIARQHWVPATRKSGQGALRSFYGWAHRTGLVAADPTVFLDPVRVPKRLPRPADDAAARAELAVADPARRLMVGLAARCGLRRSEIAAVHTDDLTVGGLLVHGKGGRDRVVPLPPDLRALIALHPDGWVFPGRFGSHVHPDTVAAWIREETGTSPHPLRTRFATRAYRGSKDLFGVQKVLGHASPETTMVYTLLDTDDLAGVMAAAWAD